MERPLVVPGDAARVDAAHGKVHLAQPPSGVVTLLAIDGELADPAAVSFEETLGLDEHATRAAARVIDAALNAALGIREGFQHLNQDADDRTWGVELPSPLAFRSGEATKEIFVDLTEQISRLRALFV